IMKISTPHRILSLLLTVISSSASAQTLGTAANYDIFVLNGGRITLKESNQLFGQIGYTNGVNAGTNETIQNFQGAVYVHTGASFSYKPATFNPSEGIFTSGYNSQLTQANTDALAYGSYLGGLTSDFSYTTKLQTGYSLTSTKAQTVIDFTEVDVKNFNFNLTGRAGQSDQIIIRISDQLAFEGVHVNLTNLESKDVIWYLGSDRQFSLHSGGGSFQGTIVSPLGKVIVGATDFKGALYGKELVLGSGFKFQGNTVPEPSSSVMMIFGAASLLLVRRRKR
ncbi:MAG: PEP-CTERM sorting domain-containing protein, partial [Luteolibacter sp.]